MQVKLDYQLLHFILEPQQPPDSKRDLACPLWVKLGQATIRALR